MNMNGKKSKKTMFLDGPVSTDFIAEAIRKHSENHAIGAHQIFLGQIRADQDESGMVHSIEFTAYREMADEAYAVFREDLFSRHSLICMHVYHSLGTVSVGEINLFVFVSSRHRKDSIDACQELVEWIKKEASVWGKIKYQDESISWKANTP